MGKRSAIEWTDATWNPWHGCHKVSEGCRNCYMYSEKKRYGQDPRAVVRSRTLFRAPLGWKEPKLVFTCSWSDFFIEEADGWRDEAWNVIRSTPQHTYQILTKRPERMIDHLPWTRHLRPSPWPNVWLLVSVENQEAADLRIPHLIRTPAAVHGVSYEPALGPVDFWPWLSNPSIAARYNAEPPLLDWIIVGGESGPGARPCDLAWIRSVRDQCQASGVSLFVKQLGSKPTTDFRTRPVGHDDETWKLMLLRDSKGGDPAEWPKDLRIRQIPLR